MASRTAIHKDLHPPCDVARGQEKPATKSTKPTLRRASRACLVCRSRKVRCDVTESSPCGNCKWNNEQCVVQSRKNHKRQWRKRMTHSVLNDDFHECTGSGWSHHDGGITSKSESQDYSGNAYLFRSPTPNPGNLVVESSNISESNWHPFGDEPSSLPQSHWTPYFSTTEPSKAFPEFIKPLNAGIESEDMEYLRSKGVFDVPDPKLRNPLLRVFFDHVHPTMPILDLGDFLSVVTAPKSCSERISLLLFQAVLAAATLYADNDLLVASGFRNKRQACKWFNRKARLLYDFECELDPVVLVQTSLLLTVRGPGSALSEVKDSWYWIDTAVSLAIAAGLHLPSVSKDLSLNSKRLRRRTWWSCYIHDRLISITTRRLPLIRDAQLGVSQLTESDFNLDLSLKSEQGFALEDLCSYAHDISQQRDIAGLCIALVDLCVSLKRMFSARSIVTQRTFNEDVPPTSAAREEDEVIFSLAMRDLRSGHKSLSDLLTHIHSPLIDTIHDTKSTAAKIGAGLQVAYHAATIYLCALRMRFIRDTQPASPTEEEMCKAIIDQATEQITTMPTELGICASNQPHPCKGSGLIEQIFHAISGDSKSQDILAKATMSCELDEDSLLKICSVDPQAQVSGSTVAKSTLGSSKSLERVSLVTPCLNTILTDGLGDGGNDGGDCVRSEASNTRSDAMWELCQEPEDTCYLGELLHYSEDESLLL